MKKWHQLIRNSLYTGSVASAATTLAVAVCGEVQNGNSLAPINAISHIAWGDQAAVENDFSWKHTATGVVLNTAAVTSWAVLYESAFGERVRRGDVVGAVLGGLGVASLAYVVDYHIVPARLTPGFEKRLSTRSLGVVYSVLGLTLGLGALSTRQAK